MLKRSGISTELVLIAQVGGAGVVARSCAGMLRGGLVRLPAHGLRVGVSALVAAAHSFPLSESGVNLGKGGSPVW